MEVVYFPPTSGLELEGPRCIGIGRGVEGWAGEEKS